MAWRSTHTRALRFDWTPVHSFWNKSSGKLSSRCQLWSSLGCYLLVCDISFRLSGKDILEMTIHCPPGHSPPHHHPRSSFSLSLAVCWWVYARATHKHGHRLGRERLQSWPPWVQCRLGSGSGLSPTGAPGVCPAAAKGEIAPPCPGHLHSGPGVGIDGLG